MIVRVTALVSAVLLLAAAAPPHQGGGRRLHPVVLVPGDGGSQIEARLNRTTTGHWWCSKTSDWYDLWLNINEMLTFMVDCWKENVALQYDPKTRSTSNAAGVETRIPGFGNTTNVEWIDKSMRSFSTYFALIVSKLLPEGYVRGENIHGAPYDFRRAANEHSLYFDRLKTLIETTYKQNGDTAVVLVTHSMGSIMTLYFLHQQTQAWKDQYVRSLVSVAGVWGGTARAVKVFAVGDNLDSWFLNEKNLLWERTNPSLAWLMPSADFWTDDEVLVQTEHKNFTRTNLEEFFSALEEPNMSLMVEDTRPLIAGLKPPGVEVFCTHGSGVDTTERLIYPPGAFPTTTQPEVSLNTTEATVSGVQFWPFPNTEPTLVKGDGDGTVNIRSLKGCLRWAGQQSQAVHHHVFPGVDHLGMLRQEEPAEMVHSVINTLNKELQSSRPRKWKRKNLKSVKNNDAESTDKVKGKMKKVKVQEIYPKIEIIG